MKSNNERKEVKTKENQVENFSGWQNI